MAWKRKSSDMEHQRTILNMLPQADGSLTPANGSGRRGNDCDQSFERFCRDANIHIDLHPKSSPAKLTGPKGEVRKTWNHLWWQNREQLEAEVEDLLKTFRSNLVRYGLESTRVSSTLEQLKKLQIATPKKLKSNLNFGAKPGAPNPTTTALEPTQPFPSSPTPSVKNTGNQFWRVTKTAAAEIPKNAGVDTSFATTATKSFGTPSIFSQLSQSGTQETTATDLTDDDDEDRHAHPDDNSAMKRPSTEYYSSLSTNGANRLRSLAAQYDSSETAASTKNTSRPSLSTSTTGHFSTRDSTRDSEQWGSSIGSTAADWLQRRPDGILIEDDVDMHDTAVATKILNQRSGCAMGTSKRARLGSQQPPTPIIIDDDDEGPDSAASPKSNRAPQRFTPATTFAQFKIPDSLSRLPFELQWEIQRVLQVGASSGALTPDELERRIHPQTLGRLYDVATELKLPFRRGFDPVELPDFEKMTLCAKLQYAPSTSGSLFDVVLHGPTKGDDCALQRKFGNQNVLYVDMPNLNKPPVTHKGRNLLPKFKEMTAKQQTFLGRKWFIYLTQAHKKKKVSDPEATKAGASRLMFVAVDDGHTMIDILSYILPYHENADQAARKLYSRLELPASSTTPVLTFEPEDVEIVDDQLATNHKSDTRFLDPKIASRMDEPRVSDRVMSDGACEISHWGMWKATVALQGTDLHSAVQARTLFAGAKGMWYKASEDTYHSLDSKPPGPHLKIAKSQIKVKHGSLKNLDRHQLTLNVVKGNSCAKPSVLHTDFLPILLDRGVPREIILEVVRDQVQSDMDELEVALKDTSPLPLRGWMHRRNELWEERSRASGITTLAGFPTSREERIVRMLEAGASPSQEAFLAADISQVIKNILDTKRKNFKIPLNRSTTLAGIPDPLGCLEPGEVHVNFAKAFRDKVSGMSWPCLTGMEGLIARNPAMAPWDMQKVRFVFRPELAHLPELVILPVKGKQPLAGMLQGGDYDGDTFWVCWEPRLVEPFLNHPPPWEPPSVEFLSIKKDKKTLRDYVKNPNSEEQWLEWLSDMAMARVRFNLLGVVTKLHERLIYMEGGIRSKEAISLVHLHDYLVDADKQGYDFGRVALDRFKHKINLPNNLPTPGHWEFTKVDADDDDTSYATSNFNIKGNIIDDVYYKVIHPMAQASLDRVLEILRPAADAHDPHIAAFFNGTLISASDDDETAQSAGHILAPKEVRALIREELDGLKQDLERVHHIWRTEQRKWNFSELVVKLREKYDAIMPKSTHHPTVIEWMRRQGSDLTIWEKLKASTFARFHWRTNKRGRLVWHVAGAELCVLKALEVGPTRTLMLEAWYALRPRRQLKTLEVSLEEAEGMVEHDDDGKDILQTQYY